MALLSGTLERSLTSVVAVTKTATGVRDVTELEKLSASPDRGGQRALNVIRKDDESDLSFGTRGGLSNADIMKLLLRVVALEKESSTVRKQVTEQANEIAGLESMLMDTKKLLLDNQLESKRSFVRRAKVRGQEMSIANLRFQEAHTTNALAAQNQEQRQIPPQKLSKGARKRARAEALRNAPEKVRKGWKPYYRRTPSEDEAEREREGMTDSDSLVEL